MIVVKLHGGLGNQMFQYAFGLGLSKFYETKLFIDVAIFDNQVKKAGFTPRHFELGCFNIQTTIAESSLIEKFNRKDLYYRLKKKLGFSTYKTLKQVDFCFNDGFLHSKPPLYILGYFQSEKYFLNNHQLIKEIFTFPTFSQSLVSNYAEIITTSIDSVSLHFRRGDYVNDPVTAAFHAKCSLNYYEESVNYFLTKFKNPLFFIFSDDIEWVEKNIADWPIQKVIIKTPENTPGWVEMYLMSLCKNNIIANSSYSWWAAWLNSNPGKVVVAPEKWFSDEAINTNDIVPDTWIRRKN